MTKGVSDLETCMDFFALPERSCENLNFHTHLGKNLATSQKTFGQNLWANYTGSVSWF
jgi:hypothetical protein